ncbi:unnamed protein product [Miscanthus lutarioriparius]|uniref:non-specific serine/threonine protein kinase n=1 Tax=Miscanthus lutarioriparius TaxID=422564 RepID=A0A811SM57_9POAL|nr:unnamed protein product [Miscanthus lutarioriparius]
MRPLRRSSGHLASLGCFLFFLLLPLLSRGADMPVGSTLSPSNSATWTSPNNTFSLGFTASASSPSLFVAAISYAGGVPVWSAGAGAAVDLGGSLRLSSNGDLQLVNGSGAVLWSSNTGGQNVSAAAVQESGNLVLKDSRGATLWQSFDHPTDTVVMSQNFTSGMNLTSGSYVFSVDKGTGNLTLRWTSAATTVTYFNKGYNTSFTGNRTLSAPTLTMQTNGIVSLTDGTLTSPVVVAYSSNYGESGDMMRFVRLDEDGNFRAYSAARGSNAATEQWSAVADQCQVFGYCGNMGVCSYNGTAPVCGCPSQNFQLTDPSKPRGGCTRKVDLNSCPGNSTMLQLDNTQFLTYPPEITTEQFFVGITACRLNCLSGSSCVASTALSDGSGLCFLKVSNFVSGYQSAALPSTSFVKVCSPPLPNPVLGSTAGANSRGGSGVRAWVVAVVVLGVVSGLVLCEWALWWFLCRHSPKYGPASAQYALLDYGMVLLETVSGRRNFDVSEETGRKKFSVWAYEEYERGNLAGIVDRRLPAEDLDMAQVERALQVSFWCIQEQPAQRPSMGKVVQMLEGVMEFERPPPPKSSDSFLSTTTATSGVSSSLVSTVVSSGPRSRPRHRRTWSRRWRWAAPSRPGTVNACRGSCCHRSRT